MPVQSFEQLVVWQRAMDLVEVIYRVTDRFPQKELYGLTSQLRRAAVSVPSNIAEGQGRLTTGEFRQFLGHARGSLHEIETQVVLAMRLKYLDNNAGLEVRELCKEVGRILNGLLASLSVN